MTRISAVVNTLNEERHIVACLESLGWVDEIVVVDMHSADRTVELARRFTDRVFLHEPTGYVEPARNFAIGKATGDWVLVLDADERVPIPLAERLRRLAEGKGELSAVLLPRKNHFCGVWLSGPHSFPDYQTRFFRRGAVVWSETIHSQPEVKGRVLTLEPDPELALEHLASDTISSAIQRLDRYTSVEARSLHERGVTFHWWQMIAGPTRETVRSFFEWQVYRYGVRGVVGSLIAWFHGAMVYAKLRELQGWDPVDDPEIHRLVGRRRALWFLARERLFRGKSRAGRAPASPGVASGPTAEVGLGSVAIVNWNSRDYLERCLESLRDVAEDGTWRAIVVDNGSADGSSEMVRGRFPDATLIANPGNAGFAAANNQAFQRATGRYFLLLNPDAEVQPGALSTLAAFLDGHPECGAVAPLLLNPDGSVQRYYNRFPTLAVLAMLLPLPKRVLGRSGAVRRYFMEGEELGVLRTVEQPAAACLMVRRELYGRLGGMDPAFPIYFNDVDLCRRIWAAGSSIYLVPEARVVHHGGRGSISAPDSFAEYWMGAFRYLGKHHGLAQELALKAAFLLDAGLRSGAAAVLTFARRQGKGAARYRAWTAFRAVRGVRLVEYDAGAGGSTRGAPQST